MKKSWPGKSYDYCDSIFFKKFQFQAFSIQGGVFKYFWFEEYFQKAPLEADYMQCEWSAKP